MCIDDNSLTDAMAMDCNSYELKSQCGQYDTANFKASEQCCFCGGGLKRETDDSEFEFIGQGYCRDEDGERVNGAVIDNVSFVFCHDSCVQNEQCTG